MNNVQKARLLHALLLQEIPVFLDFTLSQCLLIVQHPEQVSKDWVNPVLSFSLWTELSRDTHLKIEQYRRELEKSSRVFAEQLFDGYGALFLIHCLHGYVQQGRCEDPRFKTAVDLFFNS